MDIIDDEIKKHSSSRKKPSILGAINYHLFYTPKKVKNGGGYIMFLESYLSQISLRRKNITQKLCVRNNFKMRSESPIASINYLVGSKYIIQFLCNIYTLRYYIGDLVSVSVFDDSSLTNEDKELIKSCDSSIKIIDYQDWISYWKSDHRSSIYRISAIYPHIKKIMIHRAMSGYQVISDCDILYYRYCSELITRLTNEAPLYMKDVTESYGVGRSSKVYEGISTSENLNAGYYAVDINNVDYHKIEFLCRKYIEEHGFSYLLEQFLTAVMLGEALSEPLDESYSVGGYNDTNRPPINMIHFANYQQGFYSQFAKIQRRIKAGSTLSTSIGAHV